MGEYDLLFRQFIEERNLNLEGVFTFEDMLSWFRAKLSSQNTE